jgi:hypothetical protein
MRISLELRPGIDSVTFDMARRTIKITTFCRTRDSTPSAVARSRYDSGGHRPEIRINVKIR